MGARRALLVAGYVEATTYLALVAAAAGRLLLGGPDLSPLLGPLHGVAFLAFCGLALEARAGLGWGLRRTLRVLAAAVIPFGGYAVGRHL